MSSMLYAADACFAEFAGTSGQRYALMEPERLLFVWLRRMPLLTARLLVRQPSYTINYSNEISLPEVFSSDSPLG